MIKKIFGIWFIQLFCVFWAVFLFLDYISNSSYFLEAFKYFEYSDLLITIFILTAIVAFLLSNRKKIGVVLEIRNFRGIYHYLFLLLLMALIMHFYQVKMGVSANPGRGTLIFISKTILYHAGLGLILLSAFNCGSYVLELLPITLEKTSGFLISLAIGFFLIAFGIFLLGIFGLLYQFVVIPFLIALLIPGWKKTFGNLSQILFKKSIPFNIHSLGILVYSLLILLIALNLDFDTRTLPLGFDGLSLYMNVPKLIAGYHGLTSGGDAYNWSLIMCLGFIMYDSTTIALLISFVPGILCILAIYRICTSLKINRNWSLFACTCFYSLPITIWFSKYDEKVDLALLFITLCCVLLFTGSMSTTGIKKTKSRFKILSGFSPDMVLWVLCGLLIGFTLGIKYTAMLNIFAMLVIIFYSNAGKYGAVAVFFLNLAIIFALDLTRFAAFEQDHMFIRYFVPLVLSLVAFYFAFRKNRQGLLVAGKKAFVFSIAIGFAFLPWAIKHSIENKKLSFESMLTGKSSLPALYSENSALKENKRTSLPIQLAYHSSAHAIDDFASFDLSSSIKRLTKQIAQLNETKTTEPDKFQNQPVETATNSEKQEEIRRYLGYETGIIRFISLPYDIAMKMNVKMIASDSGILFLIILPVFIFVFSIRQLPWNVLKMVSILFILLVSIISVQFMNGSIDYASVIESIKTKSFAENTFFRDLFLPIYFFLKQLLLNCGQILMPAYRYLTIQPLGYCFVLLTLFSIPIYFLFKSSIAGLDNISKSIIAFVYCIVQYWLILSSGIFYYGIVGFSLIPGVIALLAVRSELSSDNKERFIKRYIGMCAVVWFVLILPFQFMPTQFLYVTDKTKINCKEFIELPFARFATGLQSEREVFKQFFPPAQQSMIATLNRDKNSKILNVSTSFNYYIINNDTRIYKDDQLGIFKAMFARAKNDKTLLANELKKNKIKYILVSLNTPRIDETPDKSLTKKFNDLMTAIVNNPEFQLLFTNRIVERPDGDMTLPVNGQKVKAKYDLLGIRILDPGTDALFEIL